MNNKILGAGIGIALILVLVFAVFGNKSGKKGESAGVDLKSVKELILKADLNEAEKKIGEIAKENPDSIALGKVYFDLAKEYEKQKDFVKAKDICYLILTKYQNVDNILEVQEELGRLNVEVLTSSIVTDKDALYEIEPGDTLLKIAKKFGTTVDLIKTSNSLKSDTIQAGSRLKISKAKYKILVDKSQNTLTIFTDDDMIIKTYRVSTGKDNCTPVGIFDIVNKIKDPVWYKEGAAVPAESPENILGSRWLGFSEKGYGIHGTTDPESLGTQVTEGCIRMLNSEVEELYTMIPVGVKVTIVD